jgi:hypothetical protein
MSSLERAAAQAIGLQLEFMAWRIEMGFGPTLEQESELIAMEQDAISITGGGFADLTEEQE